MNNYFKGRDDVIYMVLRALLNFSQPTDRLDCTNDTLHMSRQPLLTTADKT